MGDLEIQGLVKRFGDNAVVNDISFSILEGEFFVLLGPSGGGKTTLLRLLCGLEQTDAGRVILAGRDVTRLPARERNIGMVFQDYGLYPHMNTYQNIAYGLEARGMPRNEVERRVKQAAERLGLTPLLQQIVVDLSGGEQQRVALARALAKDADLYLFDEPLSNLDPKLRAQARRDILMLHREKHKPSLYVTHDQTEALAIGDRIGVIAKGRLQQVGRADDLLQEPANLFVAGFIGTPPMNLVPGWLMRGEYERRRVYGDGLALTMPGRWRRTLEGYGKEQVIIGIRPGAVVQENRPGASEGQAENEVVGVVEDLQPLVGETIVTLKVGSQTWLSTVLQEVDESLRPGQAMRVGIDVEQVRLFDPDSEQVLVAA
jgi:ABC-type sugar transport system ATPase subunit